MKKQTQLTRYCLVCGLEKPLAAFLQISGTQGTNYGNICSSCRSSSAKSKRVVPVITDEESSRGSSGLKIDAKERIHTEIQQKIEEKKSQEIHREEFEKREKATLEKTEGADKQLQDEKKHRQSYLDAKQKQSFLKFKGKAQVPFSTQTISQRSQQIDASNADQQQRMETHAFEKAIEHETRLSTIDTSQVFVDSQFGELKFQSVTFRQFKDWLGEGANFRSMERLYKTKAETKPAQTSKDDKTPSDPLIEFERKTWKPTGRR